MADGSSFSDLSKATAKLVEESARRVVAVHGRQWGTTSGILIGPGIAVTAEESLERDEGLEVTRPDGTKVVATLAGRDPTTDVAVLRFDGGGAVEAPAAVAAKVGGLTVAVGRTAAGPLAAFGMIATVGDAWRSSQGGEIDAMIRADLSLSSAGEGGALVDADGGLIGMAVFGPRRRVIAIPTTTLLKAADRILKGGSVARGYLGLGVQPVAADGGKAALVVSLDPEGPAKAAGILLGDILVSWNGETISGARGIVDRLGPDSVGQSVEFGIVRGGASARATLTVGARRQA